MTADTLRSARDLRTIRNAASALRGTLASLDEIAQAIVNDVEGGVRPETPLVPDAIAQLRAEVASGIDRLINALNADNE